MTKTVKKKKMQGKSVCEIFSGSNRLIAALNARGFVATTIDILEGGAEHDILDGPIAWTDDRPHQTRREDNTEDE